jgi:hypothetical protein
MKPLYGMGMRGSTVNIARLISALIGLPLNKAPKPLALDCGLIQIPFHRGNSEKSEDTFMAYELDPNEIVEFKELLMANTIQIDTMYQLLIDKGYFTEAEFLDKMKVVSVDYRSGHT